MGGIGHTGRRGAVEMLERCHGKLQLRLDELTDAARSLGDDRTNRDALATAVATVAFLLRTAPRHEADEEESLFPRLAALGTDGIKSVLDQLATQHRAQGQLHGQLERLAGGWTQQTELGEHDARLLAKLAAELRTAYAEHIALEDAHLLPAARSLPTAELAEIADEMHARRGRHLPEGKTRNR